MNQISIYCHQFEILKPKATIHETVRRSLTQRKIYSTLIRKYNSRTISNLWLAMKILLEATASHFKVVPSRGPPEYSYHTSRSYFIPSQTPLWTVKAYSDMSHKLPRHMNGQTSTNCAISSYTETQPAKPTGNESFRRKLSVFPLFTNHIYHNW